MNCRARYKLVYKLVYNQVLWHLRLCHTNKLINLSVQIHKFPGDQIKELKKKNNNF